MKKLRVVVTRPSRKMEKILKDYERRMVRASMKHLGRDLDAEDAAAAKAKSARKKYEVFVRNLRIPMPIANPPAVVAEAVVEWYWEGKIAPKTFHKALAEVAPLLENDLLGKILRKALQGSPPKALTHRPGTPRTLVQHALLIAYSIKTTRPDLLASKRGVPSNPKLAELVYECLRVAGVPAFFFKDGSDTVLRWLRRYMPKAPTLKAH